MERMRKKSCWIYFVFLAIVTALTFGSCKIGDDDVSTTSAGSGTGCRGRSSGIKDGPVNLYLPYPNGTTYTVSQTWFGTYSHSYSGREHALDFPITENLPIWPVAAGKVMDLKEDSNTTCTSNCADANYVTVDHGGGYYAKYMHFCQNCVDVDIGAEIDGNTLIGRAGNTGWSTESHLHFEVVDWEENCTVTYGFANIADGARTALTQGNPYTSQNRVAPFSGYSASMIGGTTYEDLGIVLTDPIAWYLSNGSTITVKGNLTSAAQSEGNNGVAVFLVSKSNLLVDSPTTIAFETGITSSSFEFTYTIPAVTTGAYYLAISKSRDGSYWWQDPPLIVVY
ncbi:MAG: M23 family metallopeptidase [Proteobacteria bacterium]|nr:M23 family metallopeptidase [Pseudomonadota bacterium]